MEVFSIWNFEKFSNLNEFTNVISGNSQVCKNSGKLKGNLTLNNKIIVERLNNNCIRETNIGEGKEDYIFLKIHTQSAKRDDTTFYVKDNNYKAISL